MTDVLDVEQVITDAVGPAPTAPATRRRRIRDLFEDLGGTMTTRDLARVCLRRGVWNETDQQVILLRSVQAQVREALSSEDASGLPFAGQTTQRQESDDGHARVWKVRQAWMFDDYELNVNIRATQMEKLDHTVQGLSRECESRYGRAPSVNIIPIDVDDDD